MTKCRGLDCKDKENCKRFSLPASDIQSYAAFWTSRSTKKCDHHIPVKEKKQ